MLADGPVAVHDLEHTVGQPGGQQFGEPPAGLRASFAWLVHHRVSGHEGRAEQSGRHGDGVVPRRDDRDHAARLGNHHIGCGPSALQGVATVQRPELGVLQERVDPGVDAAPRVAAQLAGFALVHFGEFVGLGANVARCGRYRGGPFRRRGAGPVVGGGRGAPDRLITVGRLGDGHLRDGVAGARIQDADDFGRVESHDSGYPVPSPTNQRPRSVPDQRLKVPRDTIPILYGQRVRRRAID